MEKNQSNKTFHKLKAIFLKRKLNSLDLAKKEEKEEKNEKEKKKKLFS